MSKKFRRSFLTLYIPLALIVYLAAGYIFYEEIEGQKERVQMDATINAVSGSRSIERLLADAIGQNLNSQKVLKDLVVSVDAKELLARAELQQLGDKNHSMVLNSEGYRLTSDNPERKWGFMLNRQNSLATSAPATWKKIASAERGNFEDETGLWSFETVYPLTPGMRVIEDANVTLRTGNDAGRHFWKVVSFVPKKEMLDFNTKVLWSTAIYTVLIQLLLMAGCLYYTRAYLAQLQTERELDITSSAFDLQEAIMITDRDANIIRVNSAFVAMTGYSAEEVIGRKPSVLKSGRQDVKFYQNMWDTLKQQNFWSGEIWNRRKNGEVYPEKLTITAVKNISNEVSHYVAAFSDITARKVADEKIHTLAFYDPLTELPNRRMLLDRLRRVLGDGGLTGKYRAFNPNATVGEATGRYGALMSIDLDGFKKINDSRGHKFGDQLLIETANRIQSCLRDEDTVARIGADEFVVMLEGVHAQEAEAANQAEKVAEMILGALNEPYVVRGQELKSSSSIGITLFRRQDDGLDEILKRADVAMYKAKLAGKNAIRFFDPVVQNALDARLAIESDLAHALENRELLPYYQLQVDNRHRPIGAEVLLRWKHPQRGMVNPAQFIPIAEETGVILPVGKWVIEAACEQIKQWESHSILRDLDVAVNVSAQQFAQVDFVGHIMETIAKNKIDPRRLKLELTEGMLISNVDETIQKMHQLRDVGIRFSLDDFGTGYSSLSYLKKLPLDQLKIDRLFVRDIAIDHGDAAIVKTLVGIARTLGLDIIAEGVETEEQQELLEQCGCTQYQGFLFARPSSAKEFELLVSNAGTQARAGDNA